MTETAKILVVDDDKIALTMVSRLLELQKNYLVSRARSSADGLRIAELELPDLIVSDYYMDGQDGLEFCRRAKQHPLLRHTMFVLLTSEAKPEAKAHSFDIGADEYITKPFHEQEFLSRIRSLLRIKRLQDRLRAEQQEMEKLHKDLEESFYGVVALLSRLIELRVPNATIRSERGVDFLRWIAPRLELAPTEITELELAIRIHEIGKINFPEALIRKSFDTLTREERDRYTQFPVTGQSLVASVPKLKQVSRLLRSQMENYDGTGFPERLRQDEISKGAIVLRAVNVLDDLGQRSDDLPDAQFEYLHKCRGTILEPRLAQLVEEYLRVNDTAGWMNDKVQISVFDLKEGMTIAADLYTGNGVKLLAKDSILTPSGIQRVLSHHQVDPIVTGVYVVVRK